MHPKRLLNFEKKIFDRVSKRLLSSNAISAPNSKLPTPPPEEGAIEQDSEERQRKEVAERQQLREEVLLDFAAFESSIVRTQLLFNSNVQERERYATERLRIQDEAQEVKDNTAQLRLQLEEAKKQLALRKTYDELAEKILSNRLLRPRADQHANLEKLNHEIAELDRESKDYAQTWAERRAQFGRIVEEAEQLRRMIKDEKEEVERREGMEGREEGDEGEAASRGRTSAVGTPRPEVGGASPLPNGAEPDPGSLTVDHALQQRDKSPLRQSTPRLEVTTPQLEIEEDIDMAEDGEVSGDDDGVVTEDKEIEDGATDDARSRNGDQMDTT